MPQLHLYVSDETAERLRAEAAEADLSMSRYLARLVNDSTHPDWPEGYFETLAGCSPDFPTPADPPGPPARTWDSASR